MHFLVRAFKDNLQNELVAQLYRDNLIADLMKEAEEVAEKRLACKEMKDLLQRAVEIINEVFNSELFKNLMSLLHQRFAILTL